MNITYKLTRDEYQKAVAFHHKKGRRALFISAYAGLATFIILTGTDFSNTQEVINNILMAFFSIAFYILFTRMITDFQAKRIYNKSPILSNEVTLHISGKGINQDKKTNNTMLSWDFFTKWRHNETFYLLYSNANSFNVIPKRAMNTAQIQELESYLKKYIHD